MCKTIELRDYLASNATDVDVNDIRHQRFDAAVKAGEDMDKFEALSRAEARYAFADQMLKARNTEPSGFEVLYEVAPVGGAYAACPACSEVTAVAMGGANKCNGCKAIFNTPLLFGKYSINRNWKIYDLSGALPLDRTTPVWVKYRDGRVSELPEMCGDVNWGPETVAYTVVQP